MRWIAAIVVVLGVVAIAGLYYEERELPDVVWEDDSPYCPHCRTDVNWYATVCYTCQREFEWKPGKVDCPLCVSKVDAEFMRTCLEGSPDAFRATIEEELRDLALPPDVVAATLPDFVLWVESIDEGECTFCGGTGRWLAPTMISTMTEGGDPLINLAIKEMDGKCPVCFGGGQCIGCGGDRKSEQGVAGIQEFRDENVNRLSELDAGRDAASAREYLRLARSLVTRCVGTIEIFETVSIYSQGTEQVDWAAARTDLIQTALEIEHK